MPRLLLLVAAALLTMLTLPLRAQDTAPDDAAVAPLRIQLVLPESAVAPPTVQAALLQAVVARLITEPSAAVEVKLAESERLLTVTAHANPFADRGMATLPATVLQNLTARILLAWLTELDAIAAADAKQRTAAHHAEVMSKLAETKQHSLALSARIEALAAQAGASENAEENAMLQQAVIEAQRRLIDARGKLAELQAHLDFEWPVRPIRPTIVRGVGAGTLMDDAVDRLRAAGN